MPVSMLLSFPCVRIDRRQTPAFCLGSDKKKNGAASRVSRRERVNVDYHDGVDNEVIRSMCRKCGMHEQTCCAIRTAKVERMGAARKLALLSSRSLPRDSSLMIIRGVYSIGLRQEQPSHDVVVNQCITTSARMTICCLPHRYPTMVMNQHRVTLTLRICLVC